MLLIVGSTTLAAADGHSALLPASFAEPFPMARLRCDAMLVSRLGSYESQLSESAAHGGSTSDRWLSAADKKSAAASSPSRAIHRTAVMATSSETSDAALCFWARRATFMAIAASPAAPRNQ